MDLHTKAIMLRTIRKDAIKAEKEFVGKIKELDNQIEELNKQKHLEFETFEKKIEDLVKDIPEDDFASFATACLGTMSDNLNSLMIASYVKGHKNMSQVRKNEFLIMAMVSCGMIDADELEKKMFPDGFDE